MLPFESLIPLISIKCQIQNSQTVVENPLFYLQKGCHHLKTLPSQQIPQNRPLVFLLFFVKFSDFKKNLRSVLVSAVGSVSGGPLVGNSFPHKHMDAGQSWHGRGLHDSYAGRKWANYSAGTQCNA
jgi:hypothetical protein